MWESFKQWYIVPAEIHDAVHKLFLGLISDSSENFVARMKMAALRRANLPSIAKRLKLYYGKKDDESPGSGEMVNPLSKKVLKKGRIFAYGTTKNAYLKFDTGPSSQEASNDPRMSQESSSRESENSEKCLKLAKLVEALSSLVIKQENKINYLVDFLKKKMDVEVPGIDDIMEGLLPRSLTKRPRNKRRQTTIPSLPDLLMTHNS
ncbi:hypothetical protein Leryth_010690 [Lithospermum erythrorhizon]|nr:hypothetical protein Leryth_010690 [Lithospermum erythrorhizon]